MHRFFVPPHWVRHGEASLEGSVARQIARVLRMTPGDQVVLLDNSGMEYVTQLTSLSASMVRGEIVSIQAGQTEPRVQIALYQALLKGDKFGWVLQKGTELGVSAFVPLASRRAVPKERDSWQRSHYLRWKRIITEAAEQSRRCMLPVLEEVLTFYEACQGTRGRGLSLIPWEGEDGVGLGQALAGETPERVNIFIGPEGGWPQEEVDNAVSCGAVPVSLGRRVLRAETAAIAAVTGVMYAMGELGR